MKLSKDPDARLAMGGSSGGSVSFGMAWFHNDLYHRVLTYSGTYVNQQSPKPIRICRIGAFELEEHLIPAAAVARSRFASGWKSGTAITGTSW